MNDIQSGNEKLKNNWVKQPSYLLGIFLIFLYSNNLRKKVLTYYQDNY